MARNGKSTVKPPNLEAIFLTVDENGDRTGLYESVKDVYEDFCVGERIFIYELSGEGELKKPSPTVVAWDGTEFEDFDEEV